MLQKAMSVGHSVTPFSPARDFRHHHRTISTANRGYFFSSPMTPLVPMAARARRRIKNHGVLAEPTSPKVSCIGQIKLAKPKFPEKKNRAGGSKNLKKTSSTLSSFLVKEEDNKGSLSKLKRFFSFSTGKNQLIKSNSTALAAANEHSTAAVEAVAAPSLGKMKKFASSREAFGGFDWTVEMNREEAVMIPCSVSTPLSKSEGLSLCPKPKSEVNLWKRRTMDPPKPLQVKDTY
ncbi:hypothetical protein AALP_AA1G221900 [Arabis alpina]|uniref:Syringolide-induced protein 14-1-1 n=1 Tax=Arabis alpina TaxID=50452 RepID=A0A087HPV0_ARAAL|nr:hypothetical protein AALP_AA1G221900 [Arabis alpina]